MFSRKNKPLLFAIVFFPLIFAFIGLFFVANIFYANGVDCNSLLDEEKERCKKLEKRDKELDKKEEIYSEMVDIKQKQSNAISGQINSIDLEIKKLESEIEGKKEEIRNINGDIEKLFQQIQDQEVSIVKQKRIILNLLQVYYQNKQEDLLISLLGERGVSFIISSEDKITQMEEKTSEIMRNIKSLKEATEKEKQLMEEKRNKITDLYYELEEKSASTKSAKNQKRVLLSQSKSEENRYKDLLEKVEQERREIENEIEAIELYKTSQIDYSKLPPIKEGYFTYPVSPVRITQKYGKTSFSSHYYSGKHNGVDFGINYGNIYVAKEGKVIATGDNKKYAYGKWIAIDHGDGLITLYGHLSSFLVSKGSSVKEGQKIAISGDTGFSTGPHLHFSVFVSKTFDIVESKNVSGIMIPTGASLDPMRYLK